jgi:hypothetical protein
MGADSRSASLKGPIQPDSRSEIVPVESALNLEGGNQGHAEAADCR